MERIEIKGDFVLDSSVVIKWFSEENHTDIALNLREKYVKGAITIHCPDLIIYEIANALRYNKKLSESDIKNSVVSILNLGINIIVPTKKIAETSISIALQYDISVYDAYFIALAKELKFRYITSDEKLYKKIQKLDFVILLKNITIDEEEARDKEGR